MNILRNILIGYLFGWKSVGTRSYMPFKQQININLLIKCAEWIHQAPRHLIQASGSASVTKTGML